MPTRAPSFPAPAFTELQTINSDSEGENPPWLLEEAKSKDSACGEKQRVPLTVSGLGVLLREDQGLMAQPRLIPRREQADPEVGRWSPSQKNRRSTSQEQ